MSRLLLSIALVASIIGVGCAPLSYLTSLVVTSSPVSVENRDLPLIVARGEPRMWIDDVTGAPGDGNQRLASEITRQMKIAGLRFARIPAEADYFVNTDVDVYVIDIQTEVAEIVWRVVDRNGTEVGRIRQQNSIPRGMLHDRWGETATLAAGGGLQGVLAILDSLGHPPPTGL